jgi:hypothetical protein
MGMSPHPRKIGHACKYMHVTCMFRNMHTYEPDFFQVFKCVSSTEPNTQPTPEKLDFFRVSYLILTRKTRFFSSFLLGTHLKNSIFSGFFKLLNVNILSF